MFVCAAAASMLRAMRNGSRNGRVSASEVTSNAILSGAQLLADPGEQWAAPEPVRIVGWKPCPRSVSAMIRRASSSSAKSDVFRAIATTFDGSTSAAIASCARTCSFEGPEHGKLPALLERVVQLAARPGGRGSCPRAVRRG